MGEGQEAVTIKSARHDLSLVIFPRCSQEVFQITIKSIEKVSILEKCSTEYLNTDFKVNLVSELIYSDCP